ncbi:DNA/RNA non-specific endonuclease [Streptomyces halstedii]|uniref:DNA/RNA non-specific endonuclease n=1 Tax=Streptomyces halstedii TaxID=1944 RepID=UPI0034617409
MNAAGLPAWSGPFRPGTGFPAGGVTQADSRAWCRAPRGARSRAGTGTGAGEVGPKALLGVGHPFWVEALDAWIDATDLQAGEWLRTSTGTYVQITAVERWAATTSAVHNLTVSDLHTYYVLAGTAPVLVHNCNGEIDYGSISSDGRRSGIAAIITPEMVDADTGTKATRRMNPPGFVSGANGDARGHLLPKALGGSGSTPENFVRTTAAIDNGPMNEFEQMIVEHVSVGRNTIMYSSTPHYRPGSNVPFAVSIEAFDDNGWSVGRTFFQ